MNALSIAKLNLAASCGAPGSEKSCHEPRVCVSNSSTSARTVRLLDRSGPKLNALQKSDESARSSIFGDAIAAPNHKYPESGSSTCCHGRVAVLLRTGIGVLLRSARMQ